MAHPTAVHRASDRELVITRVFDASARDVFTAWTTPSQLQRWWAPKSSGTTLSACEIDLRAGGRYRFEFSHAGPEPFAFVGRYLEVVHGARLAWTNEESEDGAITTVTFEDRGAGSSLLTMRETYPSSHALDQAFDGMKDCTPEQYAQLDALLSELVVR